MNYLRRKYMALMRGVNFRGYLRAASGYPLTLTDCMDSDIVSLSVAGNAVQDGTPSPDAPVEVVGVGDKTANLFDYEYFFDNCITGILSRLVYEMKPNTNYTVSTNIPVAGGYTSVFLSTGEVETVTTKNDGVSEEKPRTVMSDENGKITITLRTATYSEAIAVNKDDFTNGKYWIMLLEGTYTADTMPEYEPYGYRVPIECRGQNLFDVSKAISDGVVSDNGITAKNIDFFLEAGTYSLQITANASCSVFLRKGQVGNGYFEKLDFVADVPKIATFTFDSDMYLRISTFATDVMFYDIQILEGTYTAETMPPYEPYYHDTVNIYTDKPLYGIDDYTDSITLDFEKKKATKTQRICERIITEPQKTKPVYRVLDDVVRFSFDAGKILGLKNHTMMSNMLADIGISFLGNKECIFFHRDYNANLYFSFNKSRINYEDGDDSTVLYEKCKDYLTEHQLIVYYVLLEPTETDISDTIDWDSLSLHLQKGTNIITSTATVEPTGMTAQYYSTKEE